MQETTPGIKSESMKNPPSFSFTSHLNMASLHVLVCLLGLVVLCHSQCNFMQLEVEDLNNPPKGCVDVDGKLHAFDSEWERDCMDCSCSTSGLSCCSKLNIADTMEAPADCEAVVNKEDCSIRYHLKSDNTKICDPN